MDDSVGYVYSAYCSHIIPRFTASWCIVTMTMASYSQWTVDHDVVVTTEYDIS